MDLDEARALVRAQHRGVLATWRSTGTPQLSPVTAGVDDDGYAVISSRQTAYKVRNLRRDPRAYLCVFPDAFYGRWVQLDGTATILDLPEAMQPLVDYYRRISGEHPDSAAAGFGVSRPRETPGALLATGLAERLRRPVDLCCLAVVGSTSEGLVPQRELALPWRPDIVVILIGANDVTHRVRVGYAVAH